MEIKKGFTIGKFAPFHLGHQFLIETALEEMDEFTILVYETDKIEIPIQKRAKWIQTLYPKVEILYAYDPPSQYGLDEESVKIQVEYIKKIVGNRMFTHFYSSEPYGEYVAKAFDVVDRRVDTKRVNMPVSGTMIRNDIRSYQEFVNPIVYQDLKKRK